MDSKKLIAYLALVFIIFCIIFSSASGITYNVMYRPSLVAGDWQLQDTITCSGIIESYLAPITNKSGFFRVDAEVNFE